MQSTCSKLSPQFGEIDSQFLPQINFFFFSLRFVLDVKIWEEYESCPNTNAQQCVPRERQQR